VAAAVNFAREHRVRLVVKGGGHSYLGTSNAPDSLLIWTRPNMAAVEVLDSFVPQGAPGAATPEPAVSVGAGAIWMDAYNAVTTVAGRYVQGGGCTTVGVGGLTQGGGFGSFSKGFGTAAANLLEAEVVTADGTVRIVNAFQDPDLFWALKGGGGGTFGVVTRFTLRTHELPGGYTLGEFRPHLGVAADEVGQPGEDDASDHTLIQAIPAETPAHPPEAACIFAQVLRRDRCADFHAWPGGHPIDEAARVSKQQALEPRARLTHDPHCGRADDDTLTIYGDPPERLQREVPRRTDNHGHFSS
jgi:FAD/FMN-containing dehydrogenase